MGSSSSKPPPNFPPYRPPKGRYPYDLPPHYLPQGLPTYGYPHHGYMPQIAPAAQPVIPPSYAAYPYAYPQQQMAMPQPQPYYPPERGHTTRPREHSKRKRTKSSRKAPVATIRFSIPGGERYQAPAQNTNSAPPARFASAGPSLVRSSTHHETPAQHSQRQSGDLSRSMSHNTTPASQSSHDRRTSTHSHAQSSQHAAAPFIPPMQPAAPPVQQRLRNPLPEPPKDIYATSPYKHLIDGFSLPREITNTGQTVVVDQESSTAKKPKKGLFSALTRKLSNAAKDTQEVKYVYLPPQQARTSGGPSASTSQVSHGPTTASYAAAPGRASSISHRSVRSHRSSMSRQGISAPEVQPIYFNQDTDYAAFLNHSPHKVCYERVDYPTATHLLEALKFMPLRPDIAETVRMCDDTADVYHISAAHQSEQNPDFGANYLATMEMVVYLKFNQHSDLRDLLLSTDDIPLVYEDPSDSFWGVGLDLDGEPGQNELGHVMERVRDRLRRDRMR